MEDPGQRLTSLVAKANDFNVDGKIPAVRYLRSSKEMEKQATTYSAEDEYENGFLLFMKMITLLVEKLPKHPTYKNLSVDQRKESKQRCKKAFTEAEKLKTHVKKKYEAEYKLWQNAEEQGIKKEQEEEARKAKEAQKALDALSIKNTASPSLPSSSILPPITTIAQPTPPLGSTTPDNEISPPSYPSVPSITPNSQIPQSPQSPLTGQPFSSDHAGAYQPTSPNNQFPPPSHVPYHGLPPQYQSSAQPSAPPSYQDITANQHITPTPSMPHFDRSAKPVTLSSLNPQQSFTPTVNRDSKPTDIISRQISDSLDGNRQVVIPADLVPRFLQAASANTSRNLETCGILNGSLSRNVLRVTHLVIPKQTATSDSCTTECEEELFEVQDKYDTITLGWIHTHPTQTAFLSSVDLHTQCSYQQLMPEAIAIVCAPKYQTTGIFRLTPDHGLKFVTNCTQSGFHPHPKNPPLFEDSPLVRTDDVTRIQIVDLRR